jgi:hypothetical protein
MDDRSGKTLLLRALTLVDIVDAMDARMIGCNRHRLARDHFSPGNFFRISDSKLSHFLCLSVAVHMDFESHA